MNQAEHFKQLMRARWGKLSPDDTVLTCARWNIAPDKLEWLSASPLRVAQGFDLAVELRPNLRLRIHFPDQSWCEVAPVGFSFLWDQQ